MDDNIYDCAIGKRCPIFGCECIDEECAWWCRFAKDCAVPLLAGMLADSSIYPDGTWHGETEEDHAE